MGRRATLPAWLAMPAPMRTLNLPDEVHPTLRWEALHEPATMGETVTTPRTVGYMDAGTTTI